MIITECIEAQKYNTQELALDYIVRQAMFTPINMTPEEGEKKKTINEIISQKVGFLSNFTNISSIAENNSKY